MAITITLTDADALDYLNLKSTTPSIALGVDIAPLVLSNIDAPPPPVDIPPPPAGPGGAETDSAGYPWDERIHPSSRERVKGGTWKLKRGIDKGVVALVQAELRQGMRVDTPPPPAAPEAVATIAPPPPAAPAAPAPGGLDFAGMLQRVTGAVTAGTMTPEAVTSVVNKHGVQNIMALAARPDLWAAVLTELGLL